MNSRPVAIVTGASSGIGSAIAKRLARTGAMVAAHYKGNEANASAVVESIDADGGRRSPSALMSPSPARSRP
jgi:NAD(P)-dependent dehydrogenase (short-subunit alcohol dehydrogenase family)